VSGSANIPVTSVSLLREITGNPSSVRWQEMYDRYRRPMAAFVASRFPSLDPEDVIQETMFALSARLGEWRYSPDDKGHFRNYLMGILKHKATDALKRRARDAKTKSAVKTLAETAHEDGDAELDELRKNALEVAVGRLMADDGVNETHKSVFRCVVFGREPPSEVAARFGVSRANVDQIKSRLTSRLKETVAKLMAV